MTLFGSLGLVMFSCITSFSAFVVDGYGQSLSPQKCKVLAPRSFGILFLCLVCLLYDFSVLGCFCSVLVYNSCKCSGQQTARHQPSVVSDLSFFLFMQR